MALPKFLTGTVHLPGMAPEDSGGSTPPHYFPVALPLVETLFDTNVEPEPWSALHFCFTFRYLAMPFCWILQNIDGNMGTRKILGACSDELNWTLLNPALQSGLVTVIFDASCIAVLLSPSLGHDSADYKSQKSQFAKQTQLSTCCFGNRKSPKTRFRTFWLFPGGIFVSGNATKLISTSRS